MLMRSVGRFALRRCYAPLAAETQYAKPVIEPNIKEQTQKTPETPAEMMKSAKEIFTPASKAEWREGIGYLGQKHGSGGLTTLARIDYGPHRYDYGQPTMPKTWFGCFFYGAWEFGHIMLVSDKYCSIRFMRHGLGTIIFFTPFYILSEMNRKEMEKGPPWLREE